MRRLIHLMLSPSCRLARLIVAEKRVACDSAHAEDARNPMPVFIDMDGTRAEGIWAIVDHLESNFPERPLAPEDPAERRASLRWLDWAMGPFHEQVTQRIVYEKARPAFHRRAGPPRPRHECDPRGARGIETGAGRDRPRAGSFRQSVGTCALRWAIWRWRRICRRWIISAKCRGANFPPPANGMCG